MGVAIEIVWHVNIQTQLGCGVLVNSYSIQYIHLHTDYIYALSIMVT